MAPTFVKETSVKLKLHIKSHALIVGALNIPLSTMDWLARQKLNKETRQLTDIMTQVDLIEIHRTCYPNTKEYTFFPASH